MFSFEKFLLYYKKHHTFYDGSYCNPNINYSMSELKKRYNKMILKMNSFYKKKNEKQKIKYEREKKEYIKKVINNDFPDTIDPKWKEIIEKIKIRDNNKCRLISVLSKQQLLTLFNNAPGFLLNKLEVAHCISRAKSQNLYYEEKNLYLINNYSHRNLDSMKCPITGNYIPKLEVISWWIKIIGKENYIWLQENL